MKLLKIFNLNRNFEFGNRQFLQQDYCLSSIKVQFQVLEAGDGVFEVRPTLADTHLGETAEKAKMELSSLTQTNNIRRSTLRKAVVSFLKHLGTPNFFLGAVSFPVPLPWHGASLPPLGKWFYVQAEIVGKWSKTLKSLDLIVFQKDDLVQRYYRVLESLEYDNRQELVIPQRERASSCVQLILGMFDDFLLKPQAFLFIFKILKPKQV
nr:hypothetical protein CFP56_15161 [Quercus suber]